MDETADTTIPAQNADPQGTLPTIDPTHGDAPDAPVAHPPPPPRPRVVRPAPVAQSASTNATPPTPEEIDADSWERFKKWQENVDAKMPEIERLRKEADRAKRQLDEWQQKQRDYERQIREAAEHNFGLILEAEAAAIGQAVNLHPEAQEDFLYFLDRNCHTDKDADGHPTVVFRDGKVEIDMNDPGWRQKMGEHLINRKPTWIKSRLANGGGGAGTPAYSRAPNDKLRSTDDLAAALARKDPRVTVGLTGIAGGRAASGR